ncbi:ACP S-malonyltransferase [Klebsiella aerogenes]|uniref:ACP S-malonyltransferase n=1 Tax=Klebsiella aerogenes TaxID=548 RepID=UPI0006684A37|nr:ACP S-malonyltransferase [Klebsiella aerogenes]ELA2720515.1 ACP S-malonyltransferase [Klebsiella aerogenes]
MIKLSDQATVLIFAGQGNPAVGMGADLWDLNTTTRKIWDCASDVTGLDLRRLCQKGPMNRLVKTTTQQSAVTAINITLYSLYAERFADANVVGSCGHSVGEYSALYAAGALTLENVFKLILARSTIMGDLSNIHKGAMLAVRGADFQTVSQLIIDSGSPVVVSCDNSPSQQVIGGTLPDLSEFSGVLMGAGLDAVKLGVSGAWHTPLMSEGIQPMRDVLKTVEIVRPNYPVLMNVTGREEYNPEKIKENLSLHLTHRVRWSASMAAFLQHIPSVRFVEISNKAYLGHLLNDFDGFSVEYLTHCRKMLAA